jgi:hypothetical protein
MTDSKNSDQLEIEKERQKTIRYGMYSIVVLVLLIGAYLVFTNKDVKKLNLNIKEGTVGLEKYDTEKPLTEQGKTETSEYKRDGETIEYTTGTVSKEVIQSLEKENVNINSNGFTGNNFISQEFNFLFYCPSPKNWNIQYNEAALTDPINNSLYTFSNKNDARFKVETIIGTNNYNLTLEQFVNSLATSSAYAGIEMSDIQYQKGNIAFMAYDNPNMGNSYIVKIIAKDNFFYIFGCSYPIDAANDLKVKTLKQMVSTFSIIQA